MHRLILVLFSLSACFAAQSNHVRRKHHRRHRQQATSGFVTVDQGNTYSFQQGQAAVADNPVAWGLFQDSKATIGWGVVNVATSPTFSDRQQAFAAGFLEGFLTQELTWQFWTTLGQYSDDKKAQLYNYMQSHDDWLRLMTKDVKPDAASGDDLYWLCVQLVLDQLDGFLAGYNAHASSDQQLTLIDFWLMNNDGDILDIERAMDKEKVASMSRRQLIELVSAKGHCSVLIKWTGQDLFVGHTTWSDFSEMFRVFKHYSFAFKNPAIHSRQSSFSSYAGLISSTDDFYQLDSGLLVTETTLNILDESLYALVSPQGGVAAWIRLLVANMLARTGEEWTTVFAKFNSGTYNNQWMIVDYNKLPPPSPSASITLPAGTLWVLEQIPGYVHANDVTNILSRDTYWASYNRPFFQDINEKSMFSHYTALHGVMFSYRDCPRARIFLREQPSVSGMCDMRRVMALNRYQTDPLSAGCPGNAIAARLDLPALPGASCDVSMQPNGATDSKITSSKLMATRTCMTRAGPTWDDQPPFRWSQGQSERGGVAMDHDINMHGDDARAAACVGDGLAPQTSFLSSSADSLLSHTTRTATRTATMALDAQRSAMDPQPPLSARSHWSSLLSGSSRSWKRPNGQPDRWAFPWIPMLPDVLTLVSATSSAVLSPLTAS